MSAFRFPLFAFKENRKDLVLFVFSANVGNGGAVLICISLIHAVLHDVFKGIESSTIQCNRKIIVKTNNFGVITYEYFKIIIQNKVFPTLRFPLFFAIMLFYFQRIIADQLLLYRVFWYFQNDFLVERTF